VIHEFRLAFRSLLRTPGLTAIIVFTLALAIGATTTIVSVVNGVLLRPLPFPDQDRLSMLWQRAPGVGVAEDWFSPAQYFDIRERVTGFEELTILFGRDVTLTGNDHEPERVGALDVSSSFFGLLGIEPTLGEAFSPADDRPGAALKVLLGQRVFERRFRGDPAVIGRTTLIDGKRAEIVGVLPPLSLDADLLPTLVTVPVFDLVLSLPLEDPQRTTHGSENYNILAKAAVGITHAELTSELLSVAEEIVRDPQSLGSGLTAGTEYRIGMVPLLEQVVGRVRLPLMVLLGATATLLTIACGNVASLLLTRAAGRKRELAIRAALGAGRRRALVSTLSEGFVLGLTGGAGGVAVAAIALATLRSVAPAELPRLGEVGIDLPVLAVAIGLSTLSSLLFGLGPALRIGKVAPADALGKNALAVGSRSTLGGGSRYLVVVQVALSVVLTVGAGLLMRTLMELESVDPGFRPEGALSFRVSLVGDRYQSAQERVRFFEHLFRRLRGLAGVRDAGGVSMLPLTRGFAWTDFTVEGYESPDERERIVADVHIATPGYFDAMGVAVLAGRSFREEDGDEPPVVVINRDFAERFWSIEDAVGKWVGRRPDERARIIGVVESVKQYGLDADPRLAVVYPHKASGRRTLYGVIGVNGDPLSFASAVREELRAIDPLVPVYGVRSMQDRVAHSLARQRLLTYLLNGFSFIALTLATIALYGVLSFTVATQTRELGIRKALGAQRENIYRLVFRSAGIVTASGIVLGVLIAVASTRYAAGLVYGVSTTDALTFVLAGVIVTSVAAVASFVPARRAANIDPVIALKQD